ncbi:MAG: hypothetical protein AB7V45_02640 [Candidatus Krumholzibacteriia bacterium]
MFKKLIILALVSLVAAGALAGVPDGALQSTSKFPVMKDDVGISSATGLLDCSGAVEIALDNVYYGTNVGAPNNVDYYSCSTWLESGGEVVYHLFLAEPAMWEASVVGNGCDLDLAVLDSCDEDLGCLIVADSGVVTNVPVSGDFYFVIDGYSGAACNFNFTINSVTPPEPVDFCALVDQGTGNSFTGTTCNGQNLLGGLDCAAYTHAGLEYYYEIFMPSGSTFTATVTSTADGALWLLDACAEPFTCLAYADDTLTGDAEVLSYTNNSGSDIWVYLGLDSWGTDSCGDFTMDFSSTTGAVANEAASMGAVKALFR